MDIVSYLMGKAAGGGGSGGGSSELAVWKVGFFGNAMGANATSITVHINGYNGKYAIISVMHRDTLTAPSGCVLLDKATLDDNANIQYVSVFKYHIQSNSVSLTFDQASYARINASAWVVESDYKLSQRETKAWNDYFNSPLSVSTSAQTLALFNAYTSQTALTNVNLIADSDGAWINQQYAGWDTPSTGAYIYQVRHYSCIISAVPKLSKFTWWVSNGVSITSVCNAEMYLYTISKA